MQTSRLTIVQLVFYIRSNPIYLKELLKGFFSCCSPNLFQSSLQGIHKSFSLSARMQIEWSSGDVIYLVWFAEVFKVSRCKLASIVKHCGVYYTKPCEQLMKKFYGDLWGWVFTSIYFGPLWETVDINEIVKSFLWASEVGVYPKPWKVCLWPG